MPISKITIIVVKVQFRFSSYNLAPLHLGVKNPQLPKKASLESFLRLWLS